MPRQPFDMMRACFWLLAIIICAVMTMLVTAGTLCSVMVLLGRFEVGTCLKIGITDKLQEVLNEVLTAVLALLLAARGPPSPPPPPPPPAPPQT